MEYNIKDPKVKVNNIKLLPAPEAYFYYKNIFPGKFYTEYINLKLAK